MNNVIDFPNVPPEHYPIDYNPVSHAVDFPNVPHDVMSAVCILDRIMADVIDNGVLTAEDIDYVLLNVSGQLKPALLRNEETQQEGEPQ